MIKKPLKVIIAGSRTIDDYGVVVRAIQKSCYHIIEVVSGKADGVDTLGERWATENNIPIKPFPAKWIVGGVFNPIAGHQRNEKMGDYADAAILIWDGQSTGTQHMMNYMKKLKKPFYLFRTDFLDLFDMLDNL